MVSERAREQVTFARTLEVALRQMGHEVRRGPDNDTWDSELVVAGVTSALSPASSYALVGLEYIGWALDQKMPLLLFVDDPDLNKTRAAAQSAQRDLDRLYAPYLMSKRVKQSQILGAVQRGRVETAIDMLASDDWAPVLVPLHPWADPAIAAKRLGVVSAIVPIDVSSAIELPPAQEMDDVPQAQLWLTDRHYSPHILEQDRVRWPVVPIDSTTLPSPTHVYSVARGVHQGAIKRMPGWWTPTPTHVARAKTVYLCDSDEGRVMSPNGPYYLTPDDVEGLDEWHHADLANAQAVYLEETAWSTATLSSHLEVSIGHVASSPKRATPKAPPPTS
jgi:hypothetical protein